MSRLNHAEYTPDSGMMDIATLSRILRTTRGLTPQQRDELHAKIRDAQKAQGVPVTPHLTSRIVGDAQRVQQPH